MVSKELLVSAAFGVATWLVIERVKRRTRRTAWVAGKDWVDKRAKFSTLMSDNLLVITDFDATITTGDSEQCHDVCGAMPYPWPHAICSRIRIHARVPTNSHASMLRPKFNVAAYITAWTGDGQLAPSRRGLPP